MKSAYELAMERLEQESGPSKKLNDEQRAAIADIDNIFDARVAEQRLSFETQIASAAIDEIARLQDEMTATLQSLEAQREQEIEAVWNAGS
jgi:hypothetical protein